MITKYNPKDIEQMELYSHLFSRAYADLLGKQEEKNYLTPAELEVGRFVSLDNYFAHMGDLYEINPKYLMLPLDETSEALFKIDANTRKVVIYIIPLVERKFI